MKKLNHNGALDLTLVIALVAVMAVGGFVVYRVTSAKDNLAKTSNNSTHTVNQAQDQDDNEAATLTEFCNGYKATFPSDWNIYPREVRETNVDCRIESYEPDDENVPASGPYYDGLSIVILKDDATKSLSDLHADNEKVLNQEIEQDNSGYTTKVISSELVSIGGREALRSEVIGGISNKPDERYTFILNNTIYTVIGLTTNASLKVKYKTFVETLEIL